jgi:diguanylate cyclase (GGDEF)-like protein/PAS domain S-box-containing protein
MMEAMPGQNTLLDQLATAVYVKDVHGRYTYVNDMACAMFGSAMDDILGRTDHDLFDLELAEELRVEDDRVWSVGETFAGENCLPASFNGSQRCYWIVRQALRDARGQIVGLAGVATDITDRKRQELELVALKNKFAATLQALPDLMFEVDLHGRYFDCHARQEDLLAAAPSSMIGKTVYEILPLEVADICIRSLHVALKKGISTGMQFQLDLPDGSHWFELSVAQKASEGGQLPHFIVLSRDITDRKKTEQALLESESLMRAIVDNTPVEYWARDLEGRCIMQNALAVKHWGSLLDKRPQDTAVTPDELALWQENNRRAYEGKVIEEEVGYQVGDESRIFHNLVAPIKVDGRIVGIVGFNQDITERKRNEEEIHRLAFFDPLTHLPNRRLMFDRLEHALIGSARRGRHGALLLLDLDNFKVLNDTHGHEVGDQLLVEVALRLKTCIRSGDTAARLGGDEFVVILEDIDGTVDGSVQAEIIAEAIQVQMNRPFRLARLPEGFPIDYRCASSIGIALFDGSDVSAKELMRRADTAMYQAKAAGRNTLRFFDPEMQAVVTHRAELEVELRKAIDEGAFHLCYQVQMDEFGNATGSEALLRWSHPVRGTVSPASFISLAEETGLIVPLGKWVLATACQQLATWSRAPETAKLTLAVNVSARQFRQSTFTEELKALLVETGAPANRLKLELTESMLLEDTESIIGKMAELKSLGICFSLDDFGTGYSSLAYLKRLPLNQLKIDQSFVRDLLTDSNDAAIAGTVVALGNSLGLEVIAEGVETDAQQQVLAGLGCRKYQGYLYSRPLPLQEFEDFLRAFEIERIKAIGGKPADDGAMLDYCI